MSVWEAVRVEGRYSAHPTPVNPRQSGVVRQLTGRPRFSTYSETSIKRTPLGPSQVSA